MTDFEALAESGRRLVRTVDALDADALALPSVLPGWSRAQVVAHLTLNAEALTGVLEGVRAGTTTPMYASQQRRDADIDALAATGFTELRERFLGSFQPFEQAVVAMPGSAWEGTFPRVPGGPEFARADIGDMRHREIEVHHADLDAGYSPDDWPAAFAETLLRRLAAHRAAEGHAFTLEATDLGLALPLGSDDLTLTGPVGRLAWWLAGRSGEGLVATGGDLPELGPWA